MLRHSRSYEETVALGEEIGTRLNGGEVITLSGALGSGKTTIVKGIAYSLHIEEVVTSPSFTLIGEYRGTFPLYHIDLYRIDSSEEFELLGGEEYIYSDGITIIEWAEKMYEYIPSDHISIIFSIGVNGYRDIEIEGLEL